MTDLLLHHEPRPDPAPDIGGCIYCGARADAGPLAVGWCSSCAHGLPPAAPRKPRSAWWVVGALRPTGHAAESGPYWERERAETCRRRYFGHAEILWRG